MKKHVVYLLAIGLLLLHGCQKEESFEVPAGDSQGSLQSDASGDCLPKTVNGSYVAATPLVAATNTISVQVNTTRVGSYLVYTDTVNGYYFRATGNFTQLGPNTVTLRGNGTPFAAGINNFVVNYDSTSCDVQVTVLPAGTGAAVFTLAGAGGSCTSATVNGSYAVGVALNATNTVTLSVNVTTIGTYNMSTTFQGMTFSKTGAFAATGAQTVTLNGSGTPTTAGANTVPITVAGGTCTFVVNVGSAAVGTLGGAGGACTPSTVNGTYAVGTALTGTNTVQVQINVTTPGTYSITTNTVAGFSFAASGTAVAGTQTITLNGTGTPTAGGAQTFTVTFGSSTCTFVVNVTGGATGTLGGGPGACTPSTVNGTYTVGTALTGSNTVTVQINATTPGAYNITTNTVTGFSFSKTGTAVSGVNTITLNGTGTPTAAGAQTFTVTFGTSTCTFVVNVVASAAADYYPTTTNSNWSYEWDDDPTDTLLIKVYPNTISAGGNTFKVFMETADISLGFDSSGYYRKSGSSYYQWVDLSTIGFDNPVWVEILFLKDDQTVGATWTSGQATGTVGGNPATIRFKYTILQQNTSVNVVTSGGTVAYPNTIVVKEEIEQFVGGTWVSLTSSIGHNENYYSRNIGFIQQYYYDGTGALDTKFEMRRYQVF